MAEWNILHGALLGSNSWMGLGALLFAMTQTNMLPPPTLAKADGKPAVAELLGTPEVRTLLGYTRRVLHLPDGHTLAAFTFSGAAQANWLFLIDSRDLSSRRIPIPHNDFASHGAALGTDGDIYIMPYGNGRGYRYHVAADRFDPVETKLPDGEYTWDAFGASNGRIYFGTYPNAYLGEYDPATKTCTLWKQAAPNTKYVTDFGEDANGRIRCKAWGPDEIWLTFDPKTRTIERAGEKPARAPTPDTARAPSGAAGVGAGDRTARLASSREDTPFSATQKSLPDPPSGDTGFARVMFIGARRFALSVPSGRLWEIAGDGGLKPLGDPRHPAEPWFLEGTKDAVVGISHYGTLFRYDLATGAFRTRQLDNRAPAGNGIMLVEALSPRCVIGGNYSQQNLFNIDPRTGKIVSSEQMIARVTGEVMCAVGLKGRGYLGIYVSSVLSVYDPKRPFAAGRNPRELMELGPRYAQTRPRDAVTDGERVYISSDSAYNRLGGALAVIDPKTEKVEVSYPLIKDQNLPSLAWDPATRLLWGGTDRWGQMRSHPPTQPSSLIYAYDPELKRVVHTLTPWPGADVTTVLGVSSTDVLVATNGQEVALIDTRTRETLFKGRLKIGIPGKVKRGSDGQSYTLAGGTLYRWDFTRNSLTPVAETPGCTYLTESEPGTWVAANSASVYRIRLPK